MRRAYAGLGVSVDRVLAEPVLRQARRLVARTKRPPTSAALLEFLDQPPRGSLGGAPAPRLGGEPALTH